MVLARENTESKEFIIYTNPENDPGKQAEKMLTEILVNNFGLPEVPHEDIGKKLEHAAFAKASEEEDWDKGIDIWFYHADKKTWLPVDITTAKKRETLDKKYLKEMDKGVRVLELSGKLVKNAHKGHKGSLVAVGNRISDTLNRPIPSEVPEYQ